MTKLDYPKDFDALLEPEVSNFLQTLSPSEKTALSSAISLKRIADMLCRDELPDCFQSVNAYGENLAVAIQEGIVRGQQGISQYR